jgi:outer membrane protein W
MPALARPLAAFAIVIASGLTSPTVHASSQDPAGWYGNLFAGPSNLGSTSLTETRNPGGSLGDRAEFGSGFGFGGALGYRYGNGWAAEVAWDYRRHSLKKLGGTTVDGDFASNTLFLNGYYRFAKWGEVRPFVGAGVGWTQEIDVDIQRAGRSLSYSRSGAAAVQLMFGGEVDLSNRWSVVADLRMMRVSAGNLKLEDGVTGGTITGSPRYRPVSLNLGVTYRF